MTNGKLLENVARTIGLSIIRGIVYSLTMVDTIINPEEKPIIPIDYLKRYFPNTLWTPQFSGMTIKDDIAFELENQLKKLPIY